MLRCCVVKYQHSTASALWVLTYLKSLVSWDDKRNKKHCYRSVETDTMVLTMSYTVRPPPSPSLTVLLPLLGPASFGVWTQLPCRIRRRMTHLVDDSSLHEGETDNRMQLVVINQRTLLSAWTEECIANAKLWILCHILIIKGFGGPKVGPPSKLWARPVFCQEISRPSLGPEHGPSSPCRPCRGLTRTSQRLAPNINNHWTTSERYTRSNTDNTWSSWE